MNEFEEHDFEILKRRVRTEADRKIFEKVFDTQTINAIHVLATKGIFDTLEHIVSTGKEAHVFVATDFSGNKRAVKIFKKETTDFKRMHEYIRGDKRFRNLKQDRRSLVFAWTQKEFKNLIAANEADLSVPLVLGFRENVLVMEFIGQGEGPAPKLRETKPDKEELKGYYDQVVDFAARFYIAGFVHADLSEYNILVKGKKLVVIDFGQAVQLNHEKAGEFFSRDAENMAKYFSKSGLQRSFKEMYGDIKKRKEALQTGKRGGCE